MKEEIEKLIEECERSSMPHPATNAFSSDLENGMIPKYTDKERYMMLRGYLLGLITPINRDGK